MIAIVEFFFSNCCKRFYGLPSVHKFVEYKSLWEFFSYTFSTEFLQEVECFVNSGNFWTWLEKALRKNGNYNKFLYLFTYQKDKNLTSSYVQFCQSFSVKFIFWKNKNKFSGGKFSYEAIVFTWHFLSIFLLISLVIHVALFNTHVQ